MRNVGIGLFLGALVFASGCLGGSDPTPTETPPIDPPPTATFVPHVIVGVPDTGINPYHELYYRPNLTAHPCTYIRDFSCDLPALNLTLGGTDYDAAYLADKKAWEALEAGTWYWIPKTVFVAVSCEAAAARNVCVLDDTNMHGTGTTSSVLMENPDALIAFKEGGSSIGAFLEDGVPVDIFSVSWGYIAPLPLVAPVRDTIELAEALSPIYVKAAGNDPRTAFVDSWSGSPRVISVGGAYAKSQSEEILATKQSDVVSYFCRPTAQTKTVNEMREEFCGTSFAAPTVAGALSKVVLGLRTHSGYNGSIANGLVDPILGVTVEDLREALNRTASYSPEAEYDNTGPTGIPLNPVAPWLQWGWGFYDGLVASTTLAHLLKTETAPDKPQAAHDYMNHVHDVKTLLYG